MEMEWSRSHQGYRVHPALLQGLLGLGSLPQAKAKAAGKTAAAAGAYLAKDSGSAWAARAQGAAKGDLWTLQLHSCRERVQQRAVRVQGRGRAVYEAGTMSHLYEVVWE